VGTSEEPLNCPNCQAEVAADSLYCSKCGTSLTPGKSETAPLRPVGPTKTLVTPLPALPEGTLIAGKFRILEEVGRGGMGIVNKAEDVNLKRPIALKFLPPHLVNYRDLKERFLVEARAAAALSHPNICVVHEVGESDGRPYIAMEFMEGETLRDRVGTDPLKPEVALDIAEQVAAGLGESHRKGIIHRDVKSANIMVTPGGRVKIMDFGLARLTGSTLVTREGTAMGTVAYMSPEQARGEEVDHRTDIWSFGVVLYEILTGRMPFKGEHEQAVIRSILKETPRPVSDIRAGIPPGIDQIVSRTLEKDPNKRYPRMEELRNDLKSISAGIVPERIKLKLMKAKLRKKKRAILSAGAAALAVIAILAFVLLTGRTEAIGSLAVLPLENLSGDPGQDYFAAGITETLITDLSRLGGLKRVTARGSAMRYKGTQLSYAKIARELRVDALVTGSVLRSEGRVSITVHLIDPETEDMVWSNRYERDLKDVIRLHNEIVAAIVGEIRVRLTPGEKARLASAQTVDPEAYDAYLKGCIEANRLSPKNLDMAMDYFRLALKKDPSFALGHIGIAGVWNIRGHLGYILPREAVPEVREAVSRALALDNRLAQAHRVLGSMLFYLEYDWEGALQSWRQAIELEPNNAESSVGRAAFDCAMGKQEGTVEAFEQALESDPYNPQLRDFFGHQLLRLRRYDEAVQQFRQVLSAETSFTSSFNGLWRAFHFKGMFDEAAEYAVQYLDAAGFPDIAETLDRERNDLGYAASMRGAAARLAEISAQSILIARFYAFAGEKSLALNWLERAYRDGDSTMVYLKVDPSFDILRDDQRFRDLLLRMNFPH
jgi:TolB-like protein/Tfp pilus assembly protein PilF